ncbi:MAG TPA: kelch repeat-containing protein [Puia sp.]|nr:kelch repeat-containing protein [Puia sp.]
MRKIFDPALGILLLSFAGCKPHHLSYTQNGNWVNRADFSGIAVGEAAVFVIADKAYVGTGVDPSHPNFRMNAMYAFEPSGNGGWSQVADFPGTPRNAAVGFTVGDLGYIATGYDGSQPLNDCWAYDPAANSWTQRASISDNTRSYPRYDGIGFGIGNFGYVATGYSGTSSLSDLWQYDPQKDEWIERRGMGKKRASAICMVYQDRAYLFGGSNNGKLLSDGWVFDPTLPDSVSWTELNHITNYTDQGFDDAYSNLTRNNAVAFVIGSKGYLTTGNSGTLNSNTWEYDFAKDSWQPKTPFYGSSREGAVGFSVSGRGYVATGYNGSAGFDDTWEFRPEEVQNLNE